jgi:hypothetical protein
MERIGRGLPPIRSGAGTDRSLRGSLRGADEAQSSDELGEALKQPVDGIEHVVAVELRRPGTVARAGELLERYVATFGPTGLAAEEVDPANGESLGNFPQAYTHIGLIHAVLAFDRAVASARGHRP